MQALATCTFVFIYGTLHILVGFFPLPMSNFFFPRTRLELLFDEPHAELKGRIVFGGLMRIAAVVGAVRALYLIAFGPPWVY